MPTWLNMISSSCFRPVRRYSRMNNKHNNNNSNNNNNNNTNNSNNNNNNGVEEEEEDVLLWGRELERHACGELSMAVVQANDPIEDYCQVETGSGATFVGVYDGHGGPDASRFISDHLFRHFLRFAQQNGTISEETLRDAFSATEDGFLTLVRRSCGIKPLIAAMGSCCLAGVIWKGTLHIANVGDSRAVIGYVGRSNKIFSEQLSKEHNASFEEVREELKSSHPEDSQIVVMKHGVWRIKGIIQVSRSIGDAYLKRPEFSLDPSFPRFQLAEPLRKPVLTAEPSICSRNLRPNDKFIIFASDGLWEHLTNQKAVEIVHNSPREGIARRLVRAALNEAARKREMRYEDLKTIEKGVRRFFHDDITVAVIFIDHDMMNKNISAPDLSVRGFVGTTGPSNFSKLQELDGNGKFRS